MEGTIEMLVLGRFYNQRVIINGGTPDEIVITVAELPLGVKVKLGFEAPQGVSIHREEIYNKLQKEASDGGSSQSDRALHGGTK